MLGLYAHDPEAESIIRGEVEQRDWVLCNINEDLLGGSTAVSEAL